MNGYLSEDAAYSYFELSHASYHYELISLTEFLERLHALRLMCSPNDPTRSFVEHILRMEEWVSRDEWYDPEDEAQSVGDRDGKDSTVEPYEDDEFGPLLLFMPASSTGLSQWRFHQYDPDWFPSVPHGHYQGQKQPKLDPYRGYIFNYSSQLNREPRKKIIALWNDNKFRSFARAAISWYMQQYPKHRWRVRNPLRIPRRRKLP